MTIQVKATGFDQARKSLKNRADVLAGIRGQFFPHQSAIIKKAINQHADSCYDNSPAKEIALKSAETWEHSGRKHINNIESTDYAVFKQYRCGKAKYALLVEFTEADRQEMVSMAMKDLRDA